MLFLPLVFDYGWNEPVRIGHACWAFMVFCAGASAIYLVNDLLDEAPDRAHPVKRFRPLAAGRISRPGYAGTAVLLLAGATAGAWLLSPRFLAVHLLFAVAAGAYSLGLKRLLLLDILMLAGFYALRIFAGSVATNTVISNWLLLFSLLFFGGLAFQKRFSELLTWVEGTSPTNRRGYLKTDLPLFQTMGITCSYLSALVLALSIQSPEVSSHYSQSGVLWWIVPCLLYWMSRIWLMAGWGGGTEDAISIAVKDSVRYRTRRRCDSPRNSDAFPLAPCPLFSFLLCGVV